MKEKLEKFVKLFPVVWVLVCYDTHPNWHFRNAFDFIFTFAGATFLAWLLDKIGSTAVEISREYDGHLSVKRLLCALAVLAVGLAVVTKLIE